MTQLLLLVLAVYNKCWPFHFRMYECITTIDKPCFQKLMLAQCESSTIKSMIHNCMTISMTSKTVDSTAILPTSSDFVFYTLQQIILTVVYCRELRCAIGNINAVLYKQIHAMLGLPNRWWGQTRRLASLFVQTAVMQSVLSKTYHTFGGVITHNFLGLLDVGPTPGHVFSGHVFSDV